jgi:hypothetical protein
MFWLTFTVLGPRSRFRSADVVGAGRNHTNLRLQLVGRLPHWLVLTHGASSFTESALTAKNGKGLR